MNKIQAFDKERLQVVKINFLDFQTKTAELVDPFMNDIYLQTFSNINLLSDTTYLPAHVGYGNVLDLVIQRSEFGEDTVTDGTSFVLHFIDLVKLYEEGYKDGYNDGSDDFEVE